MPTSGAPSPLPPNQAATRPEGVSSMVEAWLEAKDGEGTIKPAPRIRKTPGLG